jgi:hypothetical protein
MCTAKLGISNTFQCPKCSTKVCLSHRMPEDHNCRSLPKNRTYGSGKVGNIGIGTNTNSISKGSGSGTVSGRSNTAGSSGKIRSKKEDPANTLRGTAAARREKLSQEWVCAACTCKNSASIARCSVCETERLAAHEQSAYEDESDLQFIGSAARDISRNGSLESCPFCAARYADPVQLIAHVHDRHPEQQAGSTSRRTSTPSNGASTSSKKCICS